MASMQSVDPFGAVLSGRVHIAGGIASVHPDVIICSILLPIYIVGAVLNVFFFLRYSKQLRWQMATFGFCASRIVTMCTRIAWAVHPADSGIAIASQVFTNAGTVILVLVVIQCCKKSIYRSQYHYWQQHLARKAIVHKIFAALSFGILAFLAILITGAIQGFLTTDPSIQSTDTTLKRIGSVAFLVYSLMPIPLLAFIAIWRMRSGDRQRQHEVGQYGLKSWDSDSRVWKNLSYLFLAAACLIFEYAVKVTQSFANPMIDHWYYNKGAFYCTVFLPEIIVVTILLLVNMAPRYSGVTRVPGEQPSSNSPEGMLHKSEKKPERNSV